MTLASLTQFEIAQLIKQTATPALFAQTVDKRWKLARHLKYLDRALTDTLTGTDGIRRLIISMPPRHGKSELASKYLPAWFLGTFPDKRVIMVGYGAKFAEEWGGKARGILREFGWMFGVDVSKTTQSKSEWGIEGRSGGMYAVGIDGSLTGRGADLLIIDDPIKNQEEAASEVYRDKHWEFWKAAAYTRLEPNGAAIVIQTRWHEDDLTGRILAHEEAFGEKWRKVILPAIAGDGDALGRKPGEALWPERYDESRLANIEKTSGSYWWSALYQQRPSPEGGLIFKREWFEIVPEAPGQIERAVRYWDKASTEAGGDYSVGALIVVRDGIFYVADVVRGQWSSLERNRIIQQTAEMDKAMYGSRLTIWVEQEPGSGGKESAELSIRQLAGYYVKSERVTGEKTTRWRPFAAQCEGRNVKLVRGSWNYAFLDELCVAPNGVHDDQADAASGAFNKLAMKRTFAMGIA